MNTTKKGQNLLLGALILLLSNIIVKIIGAVFRIPMYNMLGDGMAYFNAAYNFYVTIYLVSTAGIPVAISRMVASSQATGNVRESKKILRVALGLFTAVGFVAMSVMLICTKSYSESIEIPDAAYCMYAIAPTLLFICISSTFRGYYQGKKNMTLSAVAQVIEALSKLLIGMAAVLIFLPVKELHITAAYAISGVTIGVVFSLLFALYFHHRERKNEQVQLENSNGEALRSSKSILRELIVICIPIAVSSCITGLTGFVDNSLIVSQLKGAGLSEGTAISLFGAYTSIVVPLFNMPPNFIYPFAISLLPNLAEAYTSKDMEKSRSVIDSSLRVASIIAFPCAIGMASVPDGIIKTLFSEMLIDGTQITNCDATKTALSIISVSIFFLAMISITNSILQAWHKEYMPIVSAFCGILVKCVVEALLVRVPGVGINGAAISTLMCHFTILLMNTIFTVKYTGYFPKISKIFLKPFASAFLCGIGAFLVYGISETALSAIFDGRMLAMSSLVLAVATAGIIYLVCLSLMKAFVREDIMMLPKGEKICKLLEKIHAIK